MVLKFYGRHIEKRREHLRGLTEADDQCGLAEKADQPPQPQGPEKGQEEMEPSPQQDDSNSLGLKTLRDRCTSDSTSHQTRPSLMEFPN